MTYIVENNGVYGLTKGQFSATADRGSKSKRGVMNTDNAIDLVAIALQLGATYVARSFSGDKEQLVPLIKGAMSHRGAALHRRDQPVRRVQQPPRLHQELRLRARPQRGGQPARLHAAPRRDHGRLRAGRCRSRSSSTTAAACACASSIEGYGAGDRLAAISHIYEHQARGEIVTGLLYVDPEADDLHEQLATFATPLNKLNEADLCPGSAALNALNAELR